MSKTQRLISGGFFGAMIVALGATATPASAETWHLSCDGSTCCAVSDQGHIGDCFVKVAVVATAAE